MLDGMAPLLAFPEKTDMAGERGEFILIGDFIGTGTIFGFESIGFVTVVDICLT